MLSVFLYVSTPFVRLKTTLLKSEWHHSQLSKGCGLTLSRFLLKLTSVYNNTNELSSVQKCAFQIPQRQFFLYADYFTFYFSHILLNLVTVRCTYLGPLRWKDSLIVTVGKTTLHFFPGYVVAIVMTKKKSVMCTCPYVLLQWFSVSYTLPPPIFPPTGVCFPSSPFPYSTELNKVCFGACMVSSLWYYCEKTFCECHGMWRCLSVMFFIFQVVCLLRALAVQPCVYKKAVCGRCLVIGAHDLWGHLINYISDIQPDEFPLWLNDMMNINDLRWITPLLLLLMIMCFMTLGEWGGKLHTTHI